MIDRPPTRRVAILIYDDVEVLDVARPFEGFSVATRVAARRDPDAALPFEVSLVSTDGAAVLGRAGSILTGGRRPGRHLLGISAGIDLALHLVERCEGSELARTTARQMDHPLTET